ncbi:MAG TPA: PilZ domain-containing protein [Halomonas sp.]|nr:PilZ domain-containing protein [Halomonas sp.]
MARMKTLSLSFKDPATLLSAYMPALENGGIFVPTRERFALGEEVHLLLGLPDDSRREPVTGQVVWVSPEGAAGRRIAGVGIHFSPESQAARARIEDLLAGQLDKRAATYTL